MYSNYIMHSLKYQTELCNGGDKNKTTHQNGTVWGPEAQ